MVVTFFPEFFLSISLIIILIFGSIVGFSAKYNYPIISYKSFTILVLFWTFILLRFKSCDYFTLYFVVDSLSIFSKIFIIIFLFFCFNFDSTHKKTFEYYVLILSSLLGLFLLSSSNDLLSVYLSIELTTFSFYILTLYLRTSAFCVEAALKYFILGAVSSAVLLFGVSLIYGLTGTTNISHFIVLDLTSYDEILSIYIEFGFVVFSFGLLFKIGCVPLHVWVSDVYEGAPTFVTVIFAVLPKISVFALFIRIIGSTKLDMWLYFLSIVGLLSILIGSLNALKQTKTKRLLAFSGISHVGFALLGLACPTLEGICAALLYILIYTCIACFIWGLVLCVKTSNGRTLYLTDHIQWLKTNPALGIIAILILFSLSGIPPLAGFFTKYNIFVASISLGLYIITLFGILISVIGVLYYLRLIKIISFEELYWKKTLKLKEPHVITIGGLGLFLIFFIIYEDLVNLIVIAIVLNS